MELALSGSKPELVAANDEEQGADLVDSENFSLDQEVDGQNAINDAFNESASNESIDNDLDTNALNNNSLDDNQSLDSDDQVSSSNHE